MLEWKFNFEIYESMMGFTVSSKAQDLLLLKSKSQLQARSENLKYKISITSKTQEWKKTKV